MATTGSVFDRSRARPILMLGIAAVAVAAGVLIVVEPLLAAAMVATLAGVLLLTLGGRVVAAFHLVLAAVLLGYALFGKGFAYLGAPPLFVGEIALLLGLLAIARRVGTARFGAVHGLLLAFMAWGAIRTVPYLATYGVDALRDAVTWAYALFAIAISVTMSPRHFAMAATFYRRVIPIILLWIPVAAGLTFVAGEAVPRAPGSDVPIVVFKAGDMAVHLAGIGAFVLLGLDRRALGGHARHVLLWPVWLINAGLVAALNRAAFLAVVTVGASVLFVRASSRWVSLALVAATMAVLVVAVDPEVDLGLPRTLSVEQFTDNLSSIFGDDGSAVNEATKDWRSRWWDTIVQYTVNGPYFATGKGFGVNLANEDGFQVLADGSLRAPHSVHLEVLARAGVPGLLLWVTLQFVFAGSVLRAAFRAFRAAPAWVPILGWIFVYWSAAMIDGSFDVYLGGPQGGIWFWTVFGLGIAAVRLSREEPGDWTESHALGRGERAS